MQFIDFHTHIYPEKIVMRATDSLSSIFGKPADWPGTAENLLIFGMAAGISKFVTLPVAMKEGQVRKINEFIIEQGQEYSAIIPFGALHAAQDNIIEEIDFIRSKGVKGVKIHPNQQGFAIDDSRMFDAYSYMSEIGLPVLFHCGSRESDLSNPPRLKKIIGMFPDLKIVAAHFGGWQVYDEAYALLRKENIHFDMSSSMYMLGLRKTAKFIRHYGAEKIFFGTDFPLCDQSKEIERFLMLDIPDSDKEKIAWQNAADFLGISC